MPLGIQPDATRLDSERINNVIVNGGTARKAAVHRDILPVGGQTWRQWIREDKTPLRTVLDPDTSRYRSQFAYKYKDQPIPFIVDGLSYGRFALERINMGQIPYDRQQADLAEYFMQAEDRLFFAGDPVVPAGGKTGLANTGTVIGTNFAVAAGTELNLTDAVVMGTSLADTIGQQLDHFKEAVANYSLILAVTPDVDDRINGFTTAATGKRMKPEMLAMLAENGNGAAAILRTPWLGATIDIGNGNLPYKVTDGTTNAALMMWSETDPLYEVLGTGLLIDSGVDEVGRFSANFTEGYLPVSYDPYSIIYSAAVDITS
jgi:hypothetical protein